MKSFLVVVEGTSRISVYADTPEEAKQAAIDVFAHLVPETLHAEVLREEEP